MALSGNITTNTAFGYVQLTWKVSNQNVANNSSTISYELKIYRDTGGITSSAAKQYSIKINGVTVASGTNTIGGEGLKTLKTGTTTIYHNSDGSKTFNLSFSQEIAITWNGSWIGTVTGSGTGTLDTIPRATMPTFHASSVELGGTLTIYLNRASENFAHVLEYKIGSLTGTIASAETAYYWAVPLNLANAIPNATSGVVTVLCHTYNGSTYLGTKSNTFTITIPSTMKPSVSVTLSEGNSDVSDKYNYYIQNKSRLNVLISASGTYGSSIKSYKTTINGVNYASNSFISNVLANSGQTTITTVVTDSRGMTTTITKLVSVTTYQAPKINGFVCNRADTSGTITDEGTCLSATINYVITDLGDSSYKLEVKEKGEADSTYVVISSGSLASLNKTILSDEDVLNVDLSYDVRLSVSDYFTTSYAYFDIGTSFTLLDFNANGQAIAIGKVSELEEGLEIAMPTIFSTKPKILTDDNILWQGNDLMNGGTTITLSKPISSQMHGIALVFSRYQEGQTMNYHFSHFFLSKKMVELFPGGGHNFMMNTEFIYWGNKYLYIKDTIITGHANNVLNKGENSLGYIMNNGAYALRYVIGI